MIITLSVIVGAVLLICCAALAIGARLPVGHVATVRKTIAASPAEVWAALTDIDAMPTWRRDLQSVRIEDSKNEFPRWVEKSSFGELPLQVLSSEVPSRLVAKIDGKDLPFGGTWMWELKPTASGTDVVITENGEVYSPAFRFMSKYVFGHTRTLQTYADQLAAKFASGGK